MIFNQIIRPFRMLYQGIMSPFRSVRFQVSSLRAYNPITRMRRNFRTARTQVSYVQSGPTRFLNRIFPPAIRRRFGGMPQASAGRAGVSRKSGEEMSELSDEESQKRAQNAKRIGNAGRQMTAVPQRSQFSQIHLIETRTGRRQVFHIGSLVNRNSIEMQLKQEQGPVTLRFIQHSTQKYSNTILLTVADKAGELRLPGHKEADVEANLIDGSQVFINEIEYTCELYAWDRFPIVTRVDAVWDTSLGPVRDSNQDAIGIYQHPEAYMFTIADGVGGGYAGDEVSEFAVKYLLTIFRDNIEYNFSWHDVLREGYEHINAEVRAFIDRSPHTAGTTLTTVVIQNWNAYIAHVGDSRIYHLRDHVMEQITTDHMKRVTMERIGSADDDDNFMDSREVLIRAIGKSDNIDPEIFTLRLQPGDKLLLCTDGITNRVSDAEIREVLQNRQIQHVPEQLITWSNERENTDNASVIVIDLMRKPYEKDIWLAQPSDRVYVGGRSWALKLKRPRELNTVYTVTSRTVFLLIVVLFALLGLFWITQSTSNGSVAQTGPVTETATMTITETFTATSSSEATETASRTPRPTATMTFTASAVPPTATREPTQVPSPIPPTSTLRPSRD